MSEEFESINSKIPDFSSVLTQRIISRKCGTESNLPPPGTVDPYQLMLKRKHQTPGENLDSPNIVQWPEEDVKKLQDYCQKMGIYGFSTKINPLVALAQLKKQFGDYVDTPLEERVPEGYEKLGTKPSYNPNYPYSQAMRKKQILHG